MGCIVPFYYNGVSGEIKILDVNNPIDTIKIQYNDKEETILIGQFKNFQIRNFLGLIQKEYEFDVGHKFVDDKRNIEIIAHLENPKPRITKGYLCRCLDCGYEFISNYHKLVTRKQGCACCANQIIVAGINSIADKEPWMVKFFIDKEDAKKFAPSSGLKVWMKCPDCGEEKYMRIADLHRHYSIGCHCKDNVSFAEKFFYQLFEQLGIKFVWQASRTTLKWIENLNRYDFYLPDYNCIVEIHGEQHYKQQGRFRRTLAEEQENDKQKQLIAIANGITNYIIINCENVSGNAILNNIKKTPLLELLNCKFEDIDWGKCFEKAVTNIDKEICDYFNKHHNMTTGDIGKIFGFNKNRIRETLIRGTEIGWCNYNASESKKIASLKVAKATREKKSIPFEVYKDGVLVGVFFNVSELENYSRENLPYLLSRSRIAEVYNGHIKSYKGFTFKKITQEEYNNREENKGCLNINLD